jgi:hypothetical protein
MIIITHIECFIEFCIISLLFFVFFYLWICECILSMLTHLKLWVCDDYYYT